jgi:GMP synthase (glutamine-hydrolysing)
MLNHRLIDPPKEPEQFVASAVKFLRKYAQNKKVFCALSGGIDSSATYLLLKEAKIETLPVFIDHGLMRIIRGVEERKYIKKLFPNVKIVDIRKDFLPKIYGEGDAERKRELFKEAYSEVISKVIKEENCDLLADGTILPDIEESFGVKIRDLKETMSLEEEQALMEQYKEGFIKSQHNLNIQYEVDATLQPVASLTKEEVREILKHFGMPAELVYRKAFPGPALAARIIGPVTAENLAFEKKVHDIVEKSVENHFEKRYGKFMIINNQGEQEPFQAFAAIAQNILKNKVTGIIDGKRSYEYPLLVKAKWDFNRLVETASHLKKYSRLLYELGCNHEGKFDVIIRSVNSVDARTASVTEFSLEFLTKISEELLKYNETRCVYYDITSKPPATIEYV